MAYEKQHIHMLKLGPHWNLATNQSMQVIKWDMQTQICFVWCKAKRRVMWVRQSYSNAHPPTPTHIHTPTHTHTHTHKHSEQKNPTLVLKDVIIAICFIVVVLNRGLLKLLHLLHNELLVVHTMQFISYYTVSQHWNFNLLQAHDEKNHFCIHYKVILLFVCVCVCVCLYIYTCMGVVNIFFSRVNISVLTLISVSVPPPTLQQ